MEYQEQNDTKRNDKNPLLIIRDLHRFIITSEGKDELREKMILRDLTFSEAQYIWSYLFNLEHFQDNDLLNDLCDYMDYIYKVESIN